MYMFIFSIDQFPLVKNSVLFSSKKKAIGRLTFLFCEC